MFCWRDKSCYTNILSAESSKFDCSIGMCCALCLQVITEYVYHLLETEVGLHREMVPQQGSAQESAVIFVSSDILSRPDHLLVLIPGSGAVRSGQWARR